MLLLNTPKMLDYPSTSQQQNNLAPKYMDEIFTVTFIVTLFQTLTLRLSIYDTFDRNPHALSLTLIPSHWRRGWDTNPRGHIGERDPTRRAGRYEPRIEPPKKKHVLSLLVKKRTRHIEKLEKVD